MKKDGIVILVIIIIFQAFLLWLAYTTDYGAHDNRIKHVENYIQKVEKRCDSLQTSIYNLEQIKSDTIIINLPQPIVKIIAK